MARLEVGVAIVDRRRLKALSASPSLDGSTIAALLGDASVAELVPANTALTHLYFGSEFCEQLFPKTDANLSAVDVAARRNPRLVLATPAANGALVARIGAVAAILPALVR